MSLGRILLALTSICGNALCGDAADELNLTDTTEKNAPAETHAGGAVLVRLVSVSNPNETLADKVFWRRFQNHIAAQTTPVKFKLDGTVVIGPCPGVVKETKEATTLFPSEGRIDLPNGDHTLIPGKAVITVKGGALSSAHPAIKISEQTVNILCAPVRLEVVSDGGAPLQTAINVSWETEPLLREQAQFSPLIIWLPVGLKYASTLGAFSISADGKISAQPADLAANVTVSSDGLRQVVSGKPSATVGAKITFPRVILQEVTGKPAVRCYSEPLIRPGEPGRIAISRKGFEDALGSKLAAERFSYSFNRGANIEWTKFTPEQLNAPAAEISGVAAKALETDAADLAWFSLPVDKVTVAGVAQYTLSAEHFGSIKVTFVVADKSCALQLLPHRFRSAFTNNETVNFTVIVGTGCAAGPAKVLAGQDARKIELGTLTLPATGADSFDSRQFTLDTKNLPEGKYLLWVESATGSSARLPVTIVNWTRRSPLLINYIQACTALWPTDDAGVQIMQDAGLEMVSTGGAVLTPENPTVDPGALKFLNNEPTRLPAELAEKRTGNDVLLETLLRHQIREIDLYSRGPGFYMEGLSYHHSYKPDVERMIRHLQIFAQQTAEYPSFWGFNYSWFPALFGYAEGGVDTDIHKHDRNRILNEAVTKAGFPELSKEERKWYDANKFSAVPETKAKALQLMQRGIAHWRAQMDLGFGVHNKLYNQAISQARTNAVNILCDNAGHDGGKYIRSLFGSMEAVSFESYSDYPEWPMSASFTTDWGKGNFPGKPLWLSVDYSWGIANDGGMVKSLFHAFGRGASGLGMNMGSTETARELQRRGKALSFISQYGAIPTLAHPDSRFTILATGAEACFSSDWRAQYAYHAMYYHLTRLGCAPSIVCDEDVATAGIPAETKVLFIVRQQNPLEPKVEAAIKSFMQNGGKVILTGDCLVEIPGALKVDRPIKHIWQMDGFKSPTYAMMWNEFESNWRAPLSEALAKTNVPALASTDPDRALAVCLNAGPVRYAVVIADEKGMCQWDVKPAPEIPVSLEGTGWTVRDLARQKTLKSTEKDGRTEVTVDLITEPATVLALYRAAPEKIEIKSSAAPTLGKVLSISCEVKDKAGQTLGPVPVKLEVMNTKGQNRLSVFRGAGERVDLPLAALDEPGAWKISAQELLTGATSVAEIQVAPAQTALAVAAIGDVQVVNDNYLHTFFQNAAEKCVIVEPGQEALLPSAKKLVADFLAAGVEARLWQVKPEEFDTIPLRWYPREEEDAPRLKLIEQGKLIGFRENMQPFIDKLTTVPVHVPERGGYAEITPSFMVGVDCIVFSGGQLAESLRSVTPWMETANVPGKSQARLVPVLSPFSANRHVVAIVSNDAEGTEKACKALPQLAGNAPAVAPAGAEAELKAIASSSEVRAVPQPYVTYTPTRKAVALFAARDGSAAVYLNSRNDTLAMVDSNGKVTATVASDAQHVRNNVMTSDGMLCEFTTRTKDGHTEIVLRFIGKDGVLNKELVVYPSGAEGLPPDYMGGFPIAPDGHTLVAGRPGGFIFGTPGEMKWNAYSDATFVPHRDGIRHPRFPVGGKFSADGKFFVVTMDTRPPGWGNMHQPAEWPFASETSLFEVATNQRVWRLRDPDCNHSAFAVLSGFNAIAKDATVTAMTDYLGISYIIDRNGKVVAQEQVNSFPTPKNAVAPREGVGVWMDDEGKLAAFGFKHTLSLWNGKAFTHVAVSELVSGCVSSDGSFAVVGLEDGQIKAFGPDGTERWTAAPGGIAPLLTAINGNQTLTVGSDAELVLLDASGKEVRRTPLMDVADKQRHEFKAAATFQAMPPPLDYREPGTLDLAKKDLAAKQISVWKPAGTGVEAFGKTFYPTTAPVSLSVHPDTPEAFLHLVYRRPQAGVAPTVTTSSAGGPQTFILDLPTPEYRVVDIPVGGAELRANITPGASLEIAECSLWSIRWPSANLAFVKPANEPRSAVHTDEGDLPDKDEAMLELVGSGGIAGVMKTCRILVENPDIDKIKGQWLPPAVSPFEVVDGKRFGKIRPWSPLNAGLFGSWLSLEFPKSIQLSHVATYDRVQKQSEVVENIAVFSIENNRETVRNGAVANDQFWRIFPITGAPVRTLGVQTFTQRGGEGLSEVEAYQKSE